MARKGFVEVGSVDSKVIGFNTLSIGSENSEKSICIVCGVHGNEHTPLYLIDKILEHEKELNNEVTIILDANQSAIRSNTRKNLIDGLDLNRIFPGKIDGSISEKVAFKIMDFVRNFDLVIDLHTFENAKMGVLGIIPNVDGKLEDVSLNALNLFFPDYIWVPNIKSDNEGKYGGASEGKPNFVLEFQSSRKLNEDEIGNYALRLLELLKDPFKKAEKSSPLIERIEVRANYSGVFIPNSERFIGEDIKKGVEVGEIFSIADKERIKVISEQEGILIQIHDTSFVNSDEGVFSIGKNFNN